MAATTLQEAKPRQLQITRLRREEEEETWISGEELYTEGSSDDEGHTSTQSRTHHHLHMLERRISAPPNMNKWQLSLQESSEPVLRDEPHLTETTRRFSQMGVELPLRAQHALRSNSEHGRKEGEDEKVEEQEEVMLWRPKRGSLKLPRLEMDSSCHRPSSGEKASGYPLVQ